MRLPILAVYLLCATLAASAQQAPSPAATDPIAFARDRIDAMLRTGHADASWFAQSFLDKAPASKVDDAIADLKSTLGDYKSVEFAQTRFIAHFAKGTDDVLIHLDAGYRIDGLLFRPPVVASASLDDALRDLRMLHGTLSYVILEQGRGERVALNASMPLAVGSAFKLAVLNALSDEITAGRRHWDDVVPLKAQWKSLPTGVLQTWPAETPLTLATYASQMISISDNTAADALIAIVGQHALARYAAGNAPFLTTRQTFALKATRSADLLTAYLHAPTADIRARVLLQADMRALPAPYELLGTPELNVEWHYSVAQLCDLMRNVAGMALMSINPGTANASLFQHVAYKGGSDVGAINMTTMVMTKQGSRVCFSATLNDAHQALDETAFENAYTVALQFLARW